MSLAYTYNYTIADATEQTSTCGSDCEGTRDPESIQQEKKAPGIAWNVKAFVSLYTV